MKARFIEADLHPTLAGKVRYYTDLIYLMVRGEIGATHFRKLLGNLWFIFTPLYSALCYFYLTQIVFGYSTGKHHLLYLFISITFWNWFATSISASPAIVHSCGGIIQSIRFPAEIAIFTSAARTLFDVFIRVAIIIVACLIFADGLSWHLLYLPAVMLVQAMVCLSLMPYFALIGVFLRDLVNFIGVFITIGFYLSPVIYEADKIPDVIQPFLVYNPFTHILPAYQNIFLHHQSPNLLPLALIFVIFAVVFAVGLALFRRTSIYFYRFL